MKKIKEYFQTTKFVRYDLMIIITMVICVIVCLRLNCDISTIFKNTDEVSYAYIGKEYDDTYYVIDDGHTRLLGFNDNLNVVQKIVDPTDGKSSGLYIDDFVVSDGDVILSGSEWNGMYLDREAILRYDNKSNYVETLYANDYASSGNDTNKHRFYGLHVDNDALLFGEALSDSIKIHTINLSTLDDESYIIQYPDAFNAVSDLVFDDNIPYVLNKNGTIRRYQSPDVSSILYTVDTAGENSRVPFRFVAEDGICYVTDIYNREVIQITPDVKTSKTLLKDTGSQTVTLGKDGKLLLCEEDGLRVVGETETIYSSLHRLSSEVMKQYIYLFFYVVAMIQGLFLIGRFLNFVIRIRPDVTRILSSAVIVITILVSGFISYRLLVSFKSSYLDKMKEQLESAALVVSSGINESDLDGVQTAADFGNAEYKNLCSLMERSFPSSVDFYRTAYCNILRLDNNGNGYGLAYLDQSIGVYLPLDDVEEAEVKEVYDTKEVVWDDAVEDITGTYLSVKVPIFNRNDAVVGVVSVGADTYVVNNIIRAMEMQTLFSILVIIMLVWVLSTEFLSYVGAQQTYQESYKKVGKKAVPIHLIRLLIFGVFGAFNIVSSFLPVFVLRNTPEFSFINKEFLASVPLTVNIFVIGMMSLSCTHFIKKLGNKNIFLVSCASSLIGNLLIFLLPNFFTILLGLLLDGFGVGLMTNSLYVVIAALKDETQRQNCLSVYNSASLSGINFGMILGGVLAVSISQRNVFLAVAFTWLLMLLLCSILTKAIDSMKTDEIEEEERDDVGAAAFLKNKTIWSFIALIQNPYIVFNSFVFYFVPIFCENLGYSETVVSVFLMLYSQIAVLGGNSLTQKADEYFKDKAMYVALGLNIIAIAVFAILRNTTGMVIALIILGISGAFGKPSQQSYYLRQSVTQEYGEDKAMGIYNFSENIGESIAPMVFSRLVGATAFGFGIFLAIITAMGSSHYFMNRKELN